MKQNQRALGIWADIKGLGLPLLVILAFTLGWSPVVKLVVTIAFGVMVVGTKLALTDWGARGADRAQRRRGRAERRARRSGATSGSTRP